MDGVGTQSTQQEWPSLQDSEMSKPPATDQTIRHLIAAFKGKGPPSGTQVADVLEAIIDSYDQRLNAQQSIIKSQQEEIVRIHKKTEANRSDLMQVVEQTNTKLKEHLTKLNDKVKRIKRESSAVKLDRGRTTSMHRGTTRGSTMALGPSSSATSGSGAFAVKDSTDSMETSGYDGSPTQHRSVAFGVHDSSASKETSGYDVSPTKNSARGRNPFRITGTEETEDDDEPNNQPPSEFDGEHTFDIDAPDDQAFHPSTSNGSKTPGPQVIGRGSDDEDRQSSTAASPKAPHHHGGGLMAAMGRAAEEAGEAMGMVRVPTMMSTMSSDDEMDEAEMHEGKLIAVTSNMLDKGDMYRSNPSVWDSMFFVLFPAVGPSCSVLVCVCWAMNIFLQLSFIYIVEVMLADDRAISPDVLQGLLQFRLGAAHSADYADRVSQRSMASQVCTQEAKLHLAGGQQNLYADISKFSESQAWLAEALVMLIQFLWASTVLRDINNTVTIFRGLKNILRSRKSTRMFLADLQDSESEDEKEDTMVKTKSKKGPDDDVDFKESNNSRVTHFYQKSGTFLRSLIEQDHGQDEDEMAHSNLVSIMKVVRWTRIYYGRFYMVCILVVIPKIILAGALWWVGAQWLAHTISLTELILNGVALAFVLDFDECLFDIFVPRRVKILVNNLEPLPLTRNAKQGSQISVINSSLKICGGVMVLCGLYLWMEPLIFWQLRQAELIMCQGDTDFIYAVNPATGLVHVAKTQGETEWTQAEYTVAGVARAPLLDQKNSHWEETDITGEMFVSSVIESSRAVFESSGGTRGTSLDEVEASDLTFKRILQMSVWSIADAAATLPCEDLAENLNVEAAKTELRQLTGMGSLSSCSDVPKQLCSDMNMTQLRALCPKTCECDATFLTTGTGRSGFFATPSFGCPTQCSTFRATENEIKFRFDVSSENIHLFNQCRDFEPHDFVFMGNCSNSNINDKGVFTYDIWLWDCTTYDYWIDWRRGVTADSGDEDWNSICYSENRDDVDFSRTDMCCACGGGQLNVKSSLECWDNWTPECLDMPREKLAWFRYVHGLFEYLYSKPGFKDGVRNVVKADYVGINASDQDEEVIVQTITLGWFFKMLATADTWEIAPSIPHPRGLTGCEFLASYEVAALLNLDLCNPGVATSIKFFCPSACQCTEASLLSECPAVCVFNCGSDCGKLRHIHPWYSLADFIGIGFTDDGTNSSICKDTYVGNATNKCPDIGNASAYTPVCVNLVLDDDDFDANSQCCLCGGGATSLSSCHDADTFTDGPATDANGFTCSDLRYAYLNDNFVNCSGDDDDFTASEMCCACSGGNDTAGLEFTVRIGGMALDSLSMIQRSNVTSELKDIVLQAVLGTGWSPSSTIDDVQMELRDGSIIAPTRVLFREITPNDLSSLAEDIFPTISGSNFSSSVVDAIGRIAGLDDDTAQLLRIDHGSILYGGVEEGSPFVVRLVDDNCSCDCTISSDQWGNNCNTYNTWSDSVLETGCFDNDDEDFTATDMCCACLPWKDYVEEGECEDTNFYNGVDENGYDCNYWNGFVDDCIYSVDTEEFSATDMCCSCGGGEIQTCVDTEPEGAEDNIGKDCRYWELFPSYCSSTNYDDEDFSMAIMCCVCGGGREV